jgi:heptaprenyl diphosphate synthase
MKPCDPTMSRDAAVAVELIHMASLVHDDIIDQAVTRRGQESINQRWGNQSAVLTGDYLFAAAFNLINQHGMKQVMEEVTRTIQIMCAGEIRQMSLAYHLEITEEEYLKKCYEKTACLFAAACKVGGLAANLDEDSIQALEQFGLALGYAFQIIDDLLDFLSDSSLLGKPSGSDLLEGNITLPVIYALQKPEYGPWLTALLEQRKLSAKQLCRVKQVLIQSHSIEECLNRAKEFIAQAVMQIDRLAPEPAHKELRNIGIALLDDYYRKLPKQILADPREVLS